MSSVLSRALTDLKNRTSRLDAGYRESVQTALTRYGKTAKEHFERSVQRRKRLIEVRQAEEGKLQRDREAFAAATQNVLSKDTLDYLKSLSNIAAPTLTSIFTGYESARADAAARQEKLLDKREDSIERLQRDRELVFREAGTADRALQSAEGQIQQASVGAAGKLYSEASGNNRLVTKTLIDADQAETQRQFSQNERIQRQQFDHEERIEAQKSRDAHMREHQDRLDDRQDDQQTYNNEVREAQIKLDADLLKAKTEREKAALKLAHKREIELIKLRHKNPASGKQGGGAGKGGITVGTIIKSAGARKTRGQSSGDYGASNIDSSYVVSKMEGLGWTRNQAIGIAANIQGESSFNPAAIGDDGQAFGLAQWHPDRQAEFQRVFGKPIKDSTADEQLEFIDYELRNTEKKAGDLLAKSLSPREAADVFTRYYERPKDPDAESAKRSLLAEEYQKQYFKQQQPEPAPVQPTPQSDEDEQKESAAPPVNPGPGQMGATGIQETLAEQYYDDTEEPILEEIDIETAKAEVATPEVLAQQYNNNADDLAIEQAEPIEDMTVQPVVQQDVDATPTLQLASYQLGLPEDVSLITTQPIEPVDDRLTVDGVPLEREPVEQPAEVLTDYQSSDLSLTNDVVSPNVPVQSEVLPENQAGLDQEAVEPLQTYQADDIPEEETGLPEPIVDDNEPSLAERVLAGYQAGDEPVNEDEVPDPIEPEPPEALPVLPEGISVRPALAADEPVEAEVALDTSNGQAVEGQLAANNNPYNLPKLPEHKLRDQLRDGLIKSETGGKRENLAFWSSSESFPSLGIAHFTWENEFSQFPELLGYMVKRGVQLPPKLKKAYYDNKKQRPWKTRAEFYNDKKGREEIMRFMESSKDIQARFVIDYTMKHTKTLQSFSKSQLKNKVDGYLRTLRSSARGIYALADYINFKGAGRTESNDKPWGVRHVLEEMRPGLIGKQKAAINEFTEAAIRVLRRRVESGIVPEDKTKNRLPGFINRVNKYRVR